ncbi:MAG: hypothetical protein WKG07_38490 [Hymenobacter sp.]
MAAAGAHGFLDKSAEADALLAAIRAVHTGQLVFPARLRARSPLPGLPPPPARVDAEYPAPPQAALSAREREIVGLVREGLSTAHRRPALAGRADGEHPPPQPHAKAGRARPGRAGALRPRARAVRACGQSGIPVCGRGPRPALNETAMNRSTPGGGKPRTLPDEQWGQLARPLWDKAKNKIT